MGGGEIERHPKVYAVIVRPTGSVERTKMFAVQLTAGKRVNDGFQPNCKVHIASFRDRLRQEQTVAHGLP